MGQRSPTTRAVATSADGPQRGRVARGWQHSSRCSPLINKDLPWQTQGANGEHAKPQGEGGTANKNWVLCYFQALKPLFPPSGSIPVLGAAEPPR